MRLFERLRRAKSFRLDIMHSLRGFNLNYKGHYYNDFWIVFHAEKNSPAFEGDLISLILNFHNWIDEHLHINPY